MAAASAAKAAKATSLVFITVIFYHVLIMVTGWHGSVSGGGARLRQAAAGLR